jgi:hypothetical protein
LVWASAESQSKNPCFVLVPQNTTQTVNEREGKVQKLLSGNNGINFIVFIKGSVLPSDGSGMEHMCSFDYAHKQEGVRDSLFKQNKK